VFDDAARLVGHAVYQRKTRNSGPPLAKQQALPAKRSGTMDGAPSPRTSTSQTGDPRRATHAQRSSPTTQQSHNAAVGDIFGFPR
jgi:hypothetical protein